MRFSEAISSLKSPLSRAVNRSLFHRQPLKMFLNNLPRLGRAFLLTIIVAMVESQHGPMDQGYGSGMEECCREKMVGSVSYTLLDDPFRGQIPHQCLNDCVYTVSGTSRPKFCFERGSVSFHLMLENCIFAVFCYY